MGAFKLGTTVFLPLGDLLLFFADSFASFAGVFFAFALARSEAGGDCFPSYYCFGSAKRWVAVTGSGFFFFSGAGAGW